LPLPLNSGCTTRMPDPALNVLYPALGAGKKIKKLLLNDGDEILDFVNEFKFH